MLTARRRLLDLVRRAHFTLGVVLAVPLVVIGLTGSILALSGGDAPPAAARAPRERGVRLAVHDVDAIVGAALRAAPSGDVPQLYVAGAGGGPARVVLTVRSAAGSARPGSLSLSVDPVSLAVTASASRAGSPYAFVHDLHANVLAGATGRKVVGWLGVALLLLGLSGPVVWWPGQRQRPAFSIRRRAGALLFARDLHRATGISVCLLLVLISLTGTFIVFPEPIGRAVGVLFATRPLWNTDEPLHHRPGVAAATADEAVRLALGAVGTGRVRSVGFPRSAQPFRVDLAAAEPGGGRSRTVTVLIDPWSRRVIDVRDPLRFSVGERIVSVLRPLHEGHMLGWAWRIVLFGVGIAPLFFAVTGIMMWVLKWSRRRTNSLAR